MVVLLLLLLLLLLLKISVLICFRWTHSVWLTNNFCQAGRSN